MHNYHNLKIYHQAIDLAEKAYKLTILLTRSEQFGLTSQIRRASTGIASNIAEGSSRNSDRDFCRFLDMALGSSFEVAAQIEISGRLKFLSQDEVLSFLENCRTLQKQIGSLSKKLRSSNN